MKQALLSKQLSLYVDLKILCKVESGCELTALTVSCKSQQVTQLQLSPQEQMINVAFDINSGQSVTAGQSEAYSNPVPTCLCSCTPLTPLQRDVNYTSNGVTSWYLSLWWKPPFKY